MCIRDRIKEKLPLLQEIHTDVFWNANDILLFEKVRKELRGLIRFLDENDGGQKRIITKLTDPIIDSQEGVQLDTDVYKRQDQSRCAPQRSRFFL